MVVTMFPPRVFSATARTRSNMASEAVRAVNRAPRSALRRIFRSWMPWTRISSRRRAIWLLWPGQSGLASSSAKTSLARFSLKEPPALSKNSRFPNFGSLSTWWNRSFTSFIKLSGNGVPSLLMGFPEGLAGVQRIMDSMGNGKLAVRLDPRAGSKNKQVIPSSPWEGLAGRSRSASAFRFGGVS